MSFKRGARLLTSVSTMLGFVPAAVLAQALDANIVTAYSPLTTSIGWRTVGQLAHSTSGSLGPFNQACAIVEGVPSTSGNVVTRSVYVLDAGNGTASSVVLNAYTKTDTITTSDGLTSDAVQFTLNQQLALSLTSQAGAVCYMAANDTSVFASTSANNFASIVDKATLTETDVANSVAASPGPVTQITATDAGFVFVTFGTGPSAGFAEYDDQSNYLAAGQSFNFTILANTVNATTF